MQIEDRLKMFGIDREIYREAEVLCLPENIYSENNLNSLLEPADQLWLVKMLQEKGLKVFTFYDAQIDVASLERRGDEKWYGHIVIDKLAIPILVGIIAGVSVIAISESNTEKQNNKININLLIKDGEKQTHMNYEGDDETLLKLLKTLSAKE